MGKECFAIRIRYLLVTLNTQVIIELHKPSAKCNAIDHTWNNKITEDFYLKNQ